MRVVGFLVLALALAIGVQATFAASVGFSGRHADCTVCHTAPALQPATANLEAPTTWSPGETYTFEASVSGGPDVLLPFRPQGGFEMEADAGDFVIPVGQAELYRTPRDGVITYEPPATLQRAWSLTWQAPPAWQEPAPVTFWLAVMAANGDHDAQLNRSSGGERGDAVDTLSITIPAAPEAVAAWQALPLSPPIVVRTTETEAGWLLEGMHGDDNATHLVVTRGDVERRIPTEGTWTVELEGPLAGVLHAEGASRRSADVDLGSDASDAPALFGLLPLGLALLARRFK